MQLYNRVGTLLMFRPDALVFFRANFRPEETSARFQPCCKAGIGELPLLILGPSFGDSPNPSMSWLIMMPGHLHKAQEVFVNTNINITSERK